MTWIDWIEQIERVHWNTEKPEEKEVSIFKELSVSELVFYDPISISSTYHRAFFYLIIISFEF